MQQFDPRSDSPASIISRVAERIISFDVYTTALMTLWVVLAVIFYPFVANASSIVVLDVFLAMAIGTMILMTAITDVPIFALFRRFYIIPVIYIMYDHVHAFVRLVHPVDYDQALIEIDRWIFGTDPTVWFEQFSHPILTEYLQICYFLFYLLPILQAIELWRAQRLEDLDVFARTMAFCYFLSYIAYFAMPAIGPRFTLHKFSLLDSELPGVFLTSTLREAVNTGGGLARGVVDPANAVNRDCMPSGHTMMTLVNIILSFRFRSKLRWFFVVIGGSLIFSTVYLRYHYVIDVLIGASLAVITMPIEPYVNQWVMKSRDRFMSLWKTTHPDS